MFTALLKYPYPHRSTFASLSGNALYGQLKAAAPAVSRLAVFATLFAALVTPAAQGQESPSVKRIEQAATLIRDNRIAEAELQLNSILKVAPNDAAALNLLGTVRAKQGRLDEAETLFSRAIRADKQLVGAHMNLAYLYLLKRAPEKTALELKEVLRLDPDNADALHKLAWLLLSQGRLDEGITLIEAAEKTNPLPASLLAMLGDAYLKKGVAAKAEESYLLALDRQGENPDALIGLGLVSRAKGDGAGAALYLGRARGVITDSPDLLYKFAMAALNSNLNGDAMAALKRAIELQPAEPSYHLLLGITWLRKPDLQEAEQAFRASLKLSPNNPSAQMHLGYTLLKQKKFAEARGWLEKSVQKDTGTPESFYYLGLIAQEQREDEQAVKLLEKAIQLAPSFANAHIALGSTYLKLKNYPRAQQELEIGVKLSPDDSKAHYNLAMLYARLKDNERAQAEMRIVERLKSSGKGQEKDGDASAPSTPSPR
ncbi:MAG TPA: tetratricopeptide repeat protein [Blastocatellia bacterium]|nr:tetratricopeptide repeat protein [Blastocatellia bacterium]